MREAGGMGGVNEKRQFQEGVESRGGIKHSWTKI